MTKKTATFLLSASVMLLASTGIFSAGRSQQGKARTADQLKDPGLIRDGSKLFATTCASSYCHGSGGLGGGAPKLRGRGLSASYLFKTISDGVSGSPMIGFKTDLSEEKIWALVAFILSSVDGAHEPSGNVRKDAESPERTGAAGTGQEASANGQSIEATAGKELFYELGSRPSCHFCHSVRGVGGHVGPDLSNSATASADELLRRITSVHDVADSPYQTVNLELKDGDRIFGVKAGEDAQSIRVYDVVAMPPVLRTIQKADIVKIEPSKKSAMPSNVGSIFTQKELQEIVAFLKSS